jgi:UDP-N-acetylmuramyl tripeptide synthase
MGGVKGRLERVRLGAIKDYSVFIDYAHTPDALENLLDAADKANLDAVGALAEDLIAAEKRMGGR